MHLCASAFHVGGGEPFMASCQWLLQCIFLECILPALIWSHLGSFHSALGEGNFRPVDSYIWSSLGFCNLQPWQWLPGGQSNIVWWWSKSSYPFWSCACRALLWDPCALVQLYTALAWLGQHIQRGTQMHEFSCMNYRSWLFFQWRPEAAVCSWASHSDKEKVISVAPASKYPFSFLNMLV